MDILDIKQDIESLDVRRILDAVWKILNCTDATVLSGLIPFVSCWKREVGKIDLGGMVYRNSNYFELAMAYIQKSSKGGCHCFIYQNASLFGPESQCKQGFVSILDTTVSIEKYETYFDVKCVFCFKKFKVTEVGGWHVPWYQWAAA